jgi:hypothetical protein
MSIHTEIDDGNIDFLHQVGIRMQHDGNNTILSLLNNNAATGGLIEFATISDDDYSIHEVDPLMDGINDAGGIYAVELRIKENFLTSSNANKIVAIDYNGQRYQNETPIKPVFTRRYWKILMRPTETV